VPTDLVWTSAANFNGYRVLLAPHLRVLDAALVQKFDAFVRGGGTLVVGAQTGLKDRHLHLVKSVQPGLLRKLAGVEVDDWSQLVEKDERICTLDGAAVPMIGFVERLKCKQAEPIAHWQGDDPLLADAPAITVNEVDRGRVIYIGGYLDERGVAAIVKHLLADRKITAIVDAPAEVEVIARRSARWRYLWLLNHSAEPQFVERVTGRELLTDSSIDGSLKLKPHGVAIVQVRI
jgi:beta-galactosidase